MCYGLFPRPTIFTDPVYVNLNFSIFASLMLQDEGFSKNKMRLKKKVLLSLTSPFAKRAQENILAVAENERA